MTITYYLEKKIGDKNIEIRNQACFSAIWTNSYRTEIVSALKTHNYIRYTYNKKYTMEKERYKYLLFMRRVPFFKQLLPNPKKIATTGEIIISLDSNALGAFFALTIVRAMEEFPEYIKKIAKLTKKKYSLSPLAIIRLYSTSTYIQNTNHWICGPIEKDKLDLPLDLQFYNENKSLRNGLYRKLYDTMGYKEVWGSNYNYEKQLKNFEKELV